MPSYELFDCPLEIGIYILHFLLKIHTTIEIQKTNILNERLTNFALYSVIYYEFGLRQVELYSVILTF
jgi:hypothetical protein